LIHKGFICKEHESGKEPEYLLAGIAFGWFEVIFADGKRTAEQKKLAVRGKELLESYQKFNIFPRIKDKDSDKNRSQPNVENT
jgi:hypothetical protein